jgi:XTP/dITP diphosphohydrolase
MTLERIILASSNKGKVAELQHLLGPAGIEVEPQSGYPVPAVEEDAPTFVENALKKARAAAAASGLPALADDSGLAVDALGGAPGVRSARFAGDTADDQANNRRLLEALADVPEGRRSAAFHCVLVLLRTPDDPTPVICAGLWRGQIALEPAGSGGFGYDPLFLPAGCAGTAAELPPGEKARISHRGQALARLLECLPMANRPA